MSKPTQHMPSHHRRQRKPGTRRGWLIAMTVVLVVGIVAAVILLRGEERADTGRAPAVSPCAGEFPGSHCRCGRRRLSSTERPLAPADGGYILNIRAVDARGTIEAEYLNPQPITIARADAIREGSNLHVFVELRAPGYPGSMYTLTYDPQRDQLAGIYFQAALQQRFDVVFVRMP